ncbi:MAG: glycosyltransferase family 2 protein [Proteobacteria bacterium]|nr:glycosyltransferase family 2 protein [Pseudomonadota bacterium]
MENTPSSTKSLIVSIVLYHSQVELLHSTISSLYQASVTALNEGHLGQVLVVLVDNSQDQLYQSSVRDALAVLRWDDFFTLKYIDAAENIGYGAGHNLALANLASDYYLVLNPDVELDRCALSVGLSALKSDETLTLVSPKVTGSEGVQEFLCKSYPSVLVLSLRAFAPVFIRSYFKSRLDHYEMRDECTAALAIDVPLASGCFMLGCSDALTAVGGFNESYFLYFEDFDLSLRLREQGRLMFLPTMQINHHGGYAASKGLGHIWLFMKSGARFFNDHGWKWI